MTATTRTSGTSPTGAKVFPPVLSPEFGGESLAEASDRLRRAGRKLLQRSGAVLFRGFACQSCDDFRCFAGAFGHRLMNYEFGSTPRTARGGGVYSSTEYPAHQSIPLHNEQAYSREWPMKIWFYSERVASKGGETPIADSREVLRNIPPSIRATFERRGLVYVRNYGNGLDVPWQQVFETHDRKVVEAICRKRGIDFQWKDDGELRTRERGFATALHPHTGERVWFNQAHLFHVSALPEDAREALMDFVGVEDLPRNVFYADGGTIEDSLLDDVRGVLSEQEVVFGWQAGDILMLDNMLVAHARKPFQGERRVSVAMAEPHGVAKLEEAEPQR